MPDEFLTFNPDVMSAATNPALSGAQQFVVQRVADLLAPRGPFSQSASSVVDPLSIVRELGKTREEFLKDDGMHWPEMDSALKNTRTILGLEQNITPPVGAGGQRPQGWFHREWTRVNNQISVALNIPKTSAKDDVRADLTHALGRSFARPFSAFVTELADVTTGYHAQLLDQVIAGCGAHPVADDPAWRSLDRDLQNLLALALALGRTGQYFAVSLAQSLDQAADAADASVRLRAAFLALPEQFTVAVGIVGADDVPDAHHFGCVPVSQPPQWPGGPSVHNAELAAFATETKAGRHAQTVLLSVLAFDAGHAYTTAGSTAENLLDQLCARHRGPDFELYPEGLAHLSSNDSVVRLTRPDGLSTADVLTTSAIAKLQNSLAFHTQARTTRNPLQVVINAWVALEALGAGARVRTPVPGGPPRTTRRRRSVGSFLPPTAAAALALAAVRNQMTGTWRLAQRAGSTSPDAARWALVVAYLGAAPGADVIDLDRWRDVLLKDPYGQPVPTGPPATDLEVAALIHDVLEAVSPYIAWRLREAGWLLRNQEELVAWGKEVLQRAHINVDRIHALRNRVIHDAIRTTGGAQQLAEVALNTLDAIYDVLSQGWIASGQDVWIALDDIQRRQNQRFLAWASTTPVPLRPNEITTK